MEVLGAIRGAFVDPPTAPPRAVAECREGEDRSRALLAMPAVRPGGLSIVKVVTALTGPQGGLGSHLLALGRDGEVLALIEAHRLTALRTAAASVLAARTLGAGDARRLAVLGAGRQARAHIEAFSAAMPIEIVNVWARRHEAALELAAFADELGLSARIAENPAQAAAGAEIVTCATPARSPLLTGGMVSSGTHLDLVGGFRPDMREVDDAVMARAAIVADTPAALREAGDLVQPIASGALRRDDVVFLADLLTGAVPIPEGEVTLFKSVGHGSEDLVAAELLLARLGLAGAVARTGDDASAADLLQGVSLDH